MVILCHSGCCKSQQTSMRLCFGVCLKSVFLISLFNFVPGLFFLCSGAVHLQQFIDDALLLNARVSFGMELALGLESDIVLDVLLLEPVHLMILRNSGVSTEPGMEFISSNCFTNRYFSGYVSTCFISQNLHHLQIPSLKINKNKLFARFSWKFVILVFEHDFIGQLAIFGFIIWFCNSVVVLFVVRFIALSNFFVWWWCCIPQLIMSQIASLVL